PPAPARLSPGALAALAGRYRLESGGLVTLEAKGDALDASLRGSDAYAAWYGAAGEARARLRPLDERTQKIAAGGAAGDYGLLAAGGGDDAQADEVRKSAEEAMSERRSRLGSVTKCEVLGSVPVRESVDVTDVRVDLEKGSAFDRYVWRGDRLRALRAV